MQMESHTGLLCVQKMAKSITSIEAPQKNSGKNINRYMEFHRITNWPNQVERRRRISCQRAIFVSQFRVRALRVNFPHNQIVKQKFGNNEKKDECVSIFGIHIRDF